MPFVSITRLRVRTVRYLPNFVASSLRAAWQARTGPGNVAVSILADSHCAFWTRTVWNDEAAMRTFMLSGIHVRIMPRLLDWCDEASLVHWVQESVVPPPWEEAYRRMLAGGRRSRVRHPSAAHQRFEFPPPSTRAELKLK